MKKLVYLIVYILVRQGVLAQSRNKKTETFKVYGNCEMCKSKIEGSLKKKDGIISKEWDVESKILKVTYDTTKTTLKDIHQKIADVGYDNELIKAKDETYNKLHGCCKYDRSQK